jgi:hypothetical protein
MIMKPVFCVPPQRGRDLNSKKINQTAALPIRLHAPAHFAAGVSKGGERGTDRKKEAGLCLCRSAQYFARGLCRRCRCRLQNTEEGPALGSASPLLPLPLERGEGSDPGSASPLLPPSSEHGGGSDPGFSHGKKMLPSLGVFSPAVFFKCPFLLFVLSARFVLLGSFLRSFFFC